MKNLPAIPTKQELEMNIRSAQKIWEQRITEVDRARRSEVVAKGDLIKATRRYISNVLRR